MTFNTRTLELAVRKIVNLIVKIKLNMQPYLF